MTDDPTNVPPQGPPALPPPSPPSPGDGPGPDPSPAAGPAPARLLRRSTSDRVVGGVAGGLGRYLEIDPVLFRVLFAVTSFFGGIGLIVYVLAWALIPEEGTVSPTVDRAVDELRRRKVPFWLAVALAFILLSTVPFHSWRPWRLGPVAVLVAAGIIGYAIWRRTPRSVPGHPASPAPPFGPAPSGPATVGWASPTDVVAPPGEPIEGSAAPETETGAPGSDGPATGVASAARRAEWVANAKAWRLESREIARERRQRKAPVRWGAFGVLVLTLGVMGLIDASRGLPLAAYGWALMAVGLAALVVGGMMRRTPWLNGVWVVLGLAIVVTFGGSRADLHDGSGNRLVAPQNWNTMPTHERMAFGKTTLDLTHLGATTGANRTIHIDQAAGEVVVDIPRDLAVAVEGNVHYGTIRVDDQQFDSDGGIGVTHKVVHGAASQRITVDVHLAAGELRIDHVGS